MSMGVEMPSFPICVFARYRNVKRGVDDAREVFSMTGGMAKYEIGTGGTRKTCYLESRGNSEIFR